MNSPAHRSNILDRDYSQIGIGVVVRNGRVGHAGLPPPVRLDQRLEAEAEKDIEQQNEYAGSRPNLRLGWCACPRRPPPSC